MWDDMTYENILNDMLNRVPSNVDKREGSVIYDALAPVAYKLAEAYFMLNYFIDLVSGDTAVGEYLDRVVADHGITRKPATYAVRKIETNGQINIGTRWGISDTSFVITELNENNVYKAKCEQLGDIGNLYSGRLDNIDNVSGITAMLTDIILSGKDEETDDNLRARLYAQIQAPSTSGNADNYIKWAMEVPGCGDAKVYPLWNGPGTVKVLVVDENMAIDENLPATVYEYIEKVRPIGAKVTVETPGIKAIDVAANIVLNGSKSLEEIRASFSAAFSQYLKNIVFNEYTVSYAKIGSILLSLAGVADYTDLLINGSTANITLNDTEMPITGTIILEVE